MKILPDIKLLRVFPIPYSQFIPKPEMMIQIRTGIIALLCSLMISGPLRAQAGGKNMSEDILYYTNKFRASKGLKPLVLNEVMSKEAQVHSQNMARKKTAFGHKGFDKRTRNIKQELGFGSAFAENVAYGHLDGKGVVDVWIDSPGHRENLLGDYEYIGIGIAEAEDGSLYFTQIFLAR
jgi:uncharacterized protein YkwD